MNNYTHCVKTQPFARTGISSKIILVCLGILFLNSVNALAAVNQIGPPMTQISGGFCAGSSDVPIYTFRMQVNGGGSTVTQLSFTTAGTYTITDISNFRLHYSTLMGNFASSTEIPAAMITAAAAGVQVMNFSLPLGNGFYNFWITADVNSSALANNISVSSINSTTPAAGGNTTTAGNTLTIRRIPTTITGNSDICVGGGTTTTILSDDVTGGTWSSSNTGIATINLAGFTVTSVAPGTVDIRHINSCGTAVLTVTVTAAPTIIDGPSAVCAGQDIQLSNGVTGGSWSSNNTSIATVSTTGIVTGGLPGTASIFYSTNCSIVTHTITVRDIPATMPATLTMCSNSSITLSNATANGTWSSSNTAAATVNAATGDVSSLAAAGNTTITYSTGCGADASSDITVIAEPTIITGASTVCAGGNIALSNESDGGTWTSDNTLIATISPTGDVGGVGEGVAAITYSTGCGADVAHSVTVTGIPSSISGTTLVCIGSGQTLSNDAAGGTWTSSNTSVATVTTNTGVVTTTTDGTTVITYTTGCGTDATMTLTVDPQPVIPTAIAGARTICIGSTTTLSNGVPGGVWSSNDLAVATIDAAGNATGTGAGIDIITYETSTACGSESDTMWLTVEAPLPTPAAITGGTALCENATLALSDATPGGTWSSTNTAAATITAGGFVTGVGAGSTTISYTVNNTCGDVPATLLLTLNPLPHTAPIDGYSGSFCAGTTLALSDITPGGTWMSNVTSIATISNTGVVTGVHGGNTTIFYSVTNGCGTEPVSLIITIDPLPEIGAISGIAAICPGSTISLSDTTAGGTWGSSAPGIAGINTGGVVTAIATGTAIISYSASNSCGTSVVTAMFTVSPLPFAGFIIGTDTVCPGNTIALSNTVAGGIWSSDFPSTAVVTATGMVYGVASGPDTIRYSYTNSCGTNVATKYVLVLSPEACSTGIITAGAIQTELKVYPNPNDGSFNVNLVSGKDEQVIITVTNVTGTKIGEYKVTTNKEQRIALDQPTGLYFISAITAEGVSVVKVMVSK